MNDAAERCGRAICLAITISEYRYFCSVVRIGLNNAHKLSLFSIENGYIPYFCKITIIESSYSPIGMGFLENKNKTIVLFCRCGSQMRAAVPANTWILPYSTISAPAAE